MTEPADIRLIIFDVDGVLTDGSIIVNDRGVESKRFYVRDGFAIRAAMSVGLVVGVVTGRSSPLVNLRLMELGVDLFIQGSKDKATALARVCERAGVSAAETAFVGDDLIDLPALRRCGYPVAVADAAAEVRAVARYVTCAAGGRGAARETIEHILAAQGRWQEVVDRYMG